MLCSSSHLTLCIFFNNFKSWLKVSNFMTNLLMLLLLQSFPQNWNLTNTPVILCSLKQSRWRPRTSSFSPKRLLSSRLLLNWRSTRWTVRLLTQRSCVVRTASRCTHFNGTCLKYISVWGQMRWINDKLGLFRYYWRLFLDVLLC